jgi:membrane associated rhomboid family serine protease
MKRTIILALGIAVALLVAYPNFQRGGFFAAASALFSVAGLVGGMTVRQNLLRKLPNELDARYRQLTKLIWIFILLIIPAGILSFLCPISDINMGVAMFIVLPLGEWSSEHHKLAERLKVKQNLARPAATV